MPVGFSICYAEWRTMTSPKYVVAVAILDTQKFHPICMTDNGYMYSVLSHARDKELATSEMYYWNNSPDYIVQLASIVHKHKVI